MSDLSRLCRSFAASTETQTLGDKWTGFDNATAWAFVWTGVASYGGWGVDNTVFVYAQGFEGAEKLKQWRYEFPAHQNMTVLQWAVLIGHVPIECAIRAMDRVGGIDPLDKADVLEAAVNMLRGLGREHAAKNELPAAHGMTFEQDRASRG